jgi:hypothetical protein
MVAVWTFVTFVFVLGVLGTVGVGVSRAFGAGQHRLR